MPNMMPLSWSKAMIYLCILTWTPFRTSCLPSLQVLSWSVIFNHSKAFKPRLQKYHWLSWSAIPHSFCCLFLGVTLSPSSVAIFSHPVTNMSSLAWLAVYDSLLGTPLWFETKMRSSCDSGTFMTAVCKCELNSLKTLDSYANQSAELYKQS